MDIEKLIEQLRNEAVTFRPNSFAQTMLLDAATALSTLQAENEKLRSDLRRLQTERDTLLAANQHLLAERDADREED